MPLRDNILTLLILLPAAGAALVLLTRTRNAARGVALATVLGSLGLSLLVLAYFDWSAGSAYAYAGEPAGAVGAAAGKAAGVGTVQLVQEADWIPALNVRYKVGVDGLSYPLVLLTTVVFALAAAASWNVRRMTRGYLALLLLLEAGVLGTFLALDFFLFYVFFEVSLLPMYFLIGIWGGPRREYAALKFFLYTLVGSIGLLVVLIGVHLASRQVFPAGVGFGGLGPATVAEGGGGTFDLVRLASPAMRAYFADPAHRAAGTTFFVLALVAFLVKLPGVPFHTWLPDAHVEGPTPVSMILAAVLLKMGGYGLLRVAYPLFPDAARALWLLVGVLGVVGILYGALCAMAQADFKRLVAYSSVSQMGFVLLGAAVMTPAGLNGAIFMMIAHGVTSAMLFFVVGVAYDRLHHRELARMGGLAAAMPVYARFATLAAFANLGLPTLCGFVGEFLVLTGAFQAARPGSAVLAATGGRTAAVYTLAALACVGLVLSAAYNLWMVQRVFLGPPRTEHGDLPDLTRREAAVLTPLAALCVLLGLFPAVFVFAFTDRTVAAMAQLWK